MEECLCSIYESYAASTFGLIWHRVAIDNVLYERRES